MEIVEASIETQTNSSIRFQEEFTARVNSLCEQLRPNIEENSSKKLATKIRIADLVNLKFQIIQRYLNLTNKLMNKLNSRNRFLNNHVPANSFLFSKKNENAAQAKRSAFRRAPPESDASK